ncbi:primosomal protein DnaI [Heyndrickxia coagulans]|uniref:primosomal protein DnaI n=1 Tax=Heyndrickxia coagulans TaxID=1398 RepID=UPI00037432A6|nr:primosomal protein DnaI [Heyndrickxia coagulans]MED4313162.1 primosomal protein DnaI [Heyndrickxia coagulans]
MKVVENINETLKRLSSNPGFRKRYEEMKQEIITHPDVRAFLDAHRGEVTRSMIEKSWMKLYEFISQEKNCSRCKSLDECVNMMKGYVPELVIEHGNIEIHYKRCQKKILEDERNKTRRLIQSMHMPKKILAASFGDFFLEQTGRLDAYDFAHRFVREYEPGKKMKGLYLFGNFGVGKSYLLGAIANELADRKQVSSLIVYVPEFFREMKDSIGDHSTGEKLDMVKQVPVLMLDDIGAETNSSWTRDEVLGPILQYRMQEDLPTFFTSNFSYEDLEYHFTYTQRGEKEELKAARILERIKYLSAPVRMEGPNQRA